MTANHRALDDSDIMLINRVKETSSLYDPSHPDFRFCQRKEETWKTVAASVGMNPMDAKRRWTCLRDRYSRELKQLRLHPDKDEYGKNDYFKQMDFLRNFVKIRKERRSKYADCKSETSSTNGKYDSSSHKEEDDSMCGGEKDLETTHVFQISKANYDGKEEITSSESTYPEYVEVEPPVDYDEYLETADPVAPTGRDSKSIASTYVPIVLSTSPPALSSIPSKRPKLLVASHQEVNHEDIHSVSGAMHNQPEHHESTSSQDITQDSAEEYFSKSIAAYLRQLSRLNKIKAKVEMFQILEKYIELEESSN